MRLSTLGGPEAGEHPRYLGQPRFVVEDVDPDLIVRPADRDVPVGERGDLREVRDYEDLVGVRESREAPTELERRLPTHALVGLVEDEHRDGVRLRERERDGDHRPRQLPA